MLRAGRIHENEFYILRQGQSASCCRSRTESSQLLAEGLRRLVGTGRFELPTPRTPSECSTRLSHVPTGRNRPHPRERGGRVDLGILHQAQRFLRFGAGFSSSTANWIFFSTGSMRSTSTRTRCP